MLAVPNVKEFKNPEENEADLIKNLLMNSKNTVNQQPVNVINQGYNQYGQAYNQYGQAYNQYDQAYNQYDQQYDIYGRQINAFGQGLVQQAPIAGIPIESNEQKVLDIINLLLTNHGDLMKVNTNGQCALYLAYTVTDKRFYDMFIKKCHTKIDILGNQQGLSILVKMIDGNLMNTLYSSLVVSIIDEKYDRDLLALALRMLIKKMDDQYPRIIGLCTDVNVVMKNNETFLTSLFKNNISSDTIVNVILSNKFAINIPNGSNETCIMLACERMLPDVVDLLLNSGADISHNSYKAVDLLVTNRTYLNDPQARDDAKKRIMELIIKKDKPFKRKTISVKKRIFKNLDVDSKIIYYDQQFGKLVPLYGTVRWSGVDDNGRLVYGIELDEMKDDATDGVFKNMRLFHCQPFHGLVVSIEVVAPDHNFIDDVPDEELTKESETSLIVNCGIPKVYFRGHDIGIQGHSRDGFLESLVFSIFAKSFVLDFFLSPIKDAPSEFTRNFKNLLSWSIVYPLREFGFVSFHKMNSLEDIFTRFNKNGTDLETFTDAFSELCPTEPLLRFVDFDNDLSSTMSLELRFVSKVPLEYISIQKILEISMAERGNLFFKVPGCLILELPEHARRTMNCRHLIPLRTINISPLLFQSFKECSKCYLEATQQCSECVKRFRSISKGLFCVDHMCDHDEGRILPQCDDNTKSHFTIELKAIICWSINRYVAYVKEDDFTNYWLRFDCRSRKHPTNNCSIPMVEVEDNITIFLNKYEIDMLEQVDRFLEPEIECLLKNVRVLIYESPIEYVLEDGRPIGEILLILKKLN